jgi:hypothetical protein
MWGKQGRYLEILPKERYNQATTKPIHNMASEAKGTALDTDSSDDD